MFNLFARRKIYLGVISDNSCWRASPTRICLSVLPGSLAINNGLANHLRNFEIVPNNLTTTLSSPLPFRCIEAIGPLAPFFFLVFLFRPIFLRLVSISYPLPLLLLLLLLVVVEMVVMLLLLESTCGVGTTIFVVIVVLFVVIVVVVVSTIF